MDCVVISDSSESDSDSEGGEAGAAQRSRPSGGGGGSAGKRPKPKPRKKKRQEVEEKPKPRKKAKKGRANESTAWTASEDEGCACSFECTCAKSRDGDGGGSSSAPAQQAQEAWEKWIFSPPATMVFASNLPATPPLYWGDKKGGNEAANLLDSMENCRLIGSIDLEFECIAVQGSKLDTLQLAKMHAPVKPTLRTVKSSGGRTHPVQWDNNGEPGSRGCYTVHRLLRGCRTGLLMPKEASTISVLEGLSDLARPEDSAHLPWASQPLLRAVCPKAGAKLDGNNLKVRVWVYVRRLLFEMIAYPPLRDVMKAIVPAAPVRKTAALPALKDPDFVSHMPTDGVGPDYAFSLAGLMKSQEHTGYRKAQQPVGLKLHMKDYQLQTLAWMLDHESLPHGLNELFWERWTFLDGSDFYYAPELGELRLEKPLGRRGGILSEEMGLGKTIEILALILSSKNKDGAPVGRGRVVGNGTKSDGGKTNSGGKKKQIDLGERAESGDVWDGEWGKAVTNDTLATIADKCSRARDTKVTPAMIRQLNIDILPQLSNKTKVRKGTLIRLREAEVAVGDVACRNRKRRSADGNGAAGEAVEQDAEMQVVREELEMPTREDVFGMEDVFGRAVAEGGTLIVVPSHLVSQWLCEIEKAAGDSLTVNKYTSENKLHKRCTLSSDQSVKECLDWPGGCPGQEGHLRIRIQELANSADIIVTTYAMLKDDKIALNRIKWDRVVLDEMQEIRSSTTDHARACEKLLCECRWMVSGTPLYTSIDDLNGELAFLGVLPFCASDSVDGFWSMRISKPFAKRSPEALELLNGLLSGVMVRHSKSQTYTDGSSILDLPSSSTRRVPVEPNNSEKYLYQFLELNALKEMGGAEAWAGEGQKTRFWLRMLREACVAPSLINGGAGCTPHLRDIDFRLRALGMGSIWNGAAAPGDAMKSYDPSMVRGMIPNDALKVLMQGRNVSDTARHHKGNHMVRHGNKEQGVYNRNRAYAMPTIQERLVEVGDQRKELYNRVNIARRDVPLLRWRWALECITSGRYWDDILPKSTMSMMFTRRAFTAIRLNQGFAVADKRLQDKHPRAEFQSAVYTDRPKLKQALTSALPTGMRVVRVRALETYDPPTAEELAFKKDDVITMCASTRAGWAALGFAWKSDKKYAPRTFFDGALCEDGSDYLLLGAISSVVAEDLGWKEGDRAQGLTRFKINGDIGIVHSCMVKVEKSRTSTMDIPSGRVANLREDQKKILGGMVGDAAESMLKITDLDPYLGILQRADAAGAGKATEDTIQQSGFQQLYEIEMGGSPNCCVCQDGCGYEQRPTYMRCAHFACEECIVRWVMYERSKNNHRASNLGSLEATCPLCRKAFNLSDLIRIIRPPAGVGGAASSSNGASAAGGSSSKSGKGKEAADDSFADSDRDRQAADRQAKRRPGFVQWMAAATEASLAQIPPPNGGVLARAQIENLSNFPSFTPELGSHLVESCSSMSRAGPLAARAAEPCPHNFSSKVQRLLSDLSIVLAQGEKAVVFSQHKQAVLHLSKVFADNRVKIGHVKIVAGDALASQEEAVKQFIEEPSISVFLLHAGQAAAGLTLTAASHVFLMEPFMKSGEQAQAMNRCHRIGQKKNVTCTLYYTPGTIEERMEAWKEEVVGADECVGAAGAESSTDALSVLDHEQQNSTESLAKMRFLFGVTSQTSADAPSAPYLEEISD